MYLIYKLFIWKVDSLACYPLLFFSATQARKLRYLVNMYRYPRNDKNFLSKKKAG